MLPVAITFILLCLLISGQEHPADKQINLVWSFPNCSREISRKVMTFLEKEVYPILPTLASHLPSTCPLHPLRNLFQDHEKHKVKLDSDDWKVKLASLIMFCVCLVYKYSMMNVWYGMVLYVILYIHIRSR
ncbi:hypothetical protein EON63_06045 [archaeon]|nr:MAG: hypothetical protein EON63_06045 [archaeon]